MVTEALTVMAALVALIAGAMRLPDLDRNRRLLGTVLVGAALAALAPPVLAAVSMSGASGFTLHVDAAHALLVTIAASTGFAFLRRITLDPAVLRWRPVPLTLAIAAVQLVVLALVVPQQPPAAAAVTTLVLTTAWPAVTTVIAGATLRAIGPLVSPAQRHGLAAAVAGCMGMGAGAALGVAASEAPLTPVHRDVLAVIAAGAGAGGLLMLTMGISMPGLAAHVASIRRWVAAVCLLHRTAPLFDALVDVAGDWVPPWGVQRAALRRPVDQVHNVLMFRQDAAHVLRPLVTDAEIAAAWGHARRYAGRDLVAVQSLSEACWLALAIERRRSGRPALAEHDSVFLDPADLARLSRTSVTAELASLDALARAWSHTDVIEEFVAAMR